MSILKLKFHRKSFNLQGPFFTHTTFCSVQIFIKHNMYNEILDRTYVEGNLIQPILGGIYLLPAIAS